MTCALAAEWAPDIRVNAIGPSYFRTDLTEVFYQNPTWCAAMLEKIPAGRFGALEDLVGAAVFLCSDASARDVTGQLLYIGGWLHGFDLTRSRFATGSENGRCRGPRIASDAGRP